MARGDPSSVVPGDMLLSEDTDPTPASRAPPPLPSFRDAALEFDAKMDEYGFERSPSQRDTEPDGNCAVYGNI